ncbi:hypothetical protein ACFL9S_21880, partial [Erwinia sp. AnSW2-5]|uniref:hypothetical protein n=1 Tax=Erwinia sp. AnSW2-5 TaxID=3367692 RepID=UPI00385A2A45
VSPYGRIRISLVKNRQKKSLNVSSDFLLKYGGERGGSLAPSLALALRAACGCAKRLSCRFVEP